MQRDYDARSYCKALRPYAFVGLYFSVVSPKLEGAFIGVCVKKEPAHLNTDENHFVL